MNIALIIAGGSGQRMGQDVPKQFLTVNDKPVIIYTLENFQNHPEIDEIAVVCIEGWHEALRAFAKQFGITKLKSVVSGGETGQASIYNGLKELSLRHNRDDLVLIHDAIRPMVSGEVLSDCIRVARQYGNAIVAIPCAEAMLLTRDGMSSTEQISRDTLKRTQTPQAARLGDLTDAHREALERGITSSVATCTLFTELGRTLYFSRGSEKNIKLTTVEDLEIFKALLSAKHERWLK